jgi:transcriptional regulator with XRE-family HTH domain
MRSDSAEESPRRGRPSSPAQNALGEYLRELRSGRGWTIRELARELGLTESAAGYISQLESGTKSPHSDLARKLARTLGDPKGIFPLWAQIGARSDPYRAALARRALAHVLGDPSIHFDPRFSRPERYRIEQGQFPTAGRPTIGRAMGPDEPGRPPRPKELPSWETELLPLPATKTVGGFSYRVPIAPLDRHPYLVTREMPDMLTIQLPRVVQYPVAYRMDEQSVRRVHNIVNPGDVIVLAREDEPIVEHELYAVWTGASESHGRIELAHALFNGRQLLILPGPGQSDFVVHETRHPYRIVVGHMVTVVRPPAS